MFRVDTINGTDLWEFGNSSKSSFSDELGFVTDSVSTYPLNSKGILEYRTPFIGNQILLFEHKINSDTLLDGGYVRVSCDKGLTWENLGTQEADYLKCSSSSTFYVNYPDEYWGPNIQDTIPAFTGNSDWMWSAVQFSDIAVKVNWVDSVYFQFIFESDAIDSGKDGWMIRKIVNATADIASSIHENEPSEELVYYPNPTTDRIRVRLGTTSNVVTINLYNALGELVQSEKQCAFDILDYAMPKPEGVYLLQLVYSEEKVVNLQVVKE